MSTFARAIIVIPISMLAASITAGAQEYSAPRTIGSAEVPDSVLALFRKTFNVHGDIADTTCTYTSGNVQEFKIRPTWSVERRKITDVDKMNGLTAATRYTIGLSAERVYRLPRTGVLDPAPGQWSLWSQPQSFIYGPKGFSAVLGVINGRDEVRSGDSPACSAYIFAGAEAAPDAAAPVTKAPIHGAIARSPGASVSVAVAKAWTSKATDGTYYLHVQSAITASQSVEVSPADFRLNLKLSNGASMVLVPLDAPAPNVARGGLLSTMNSILSQTSSVAASLPQKNGNRTAPQSDASPTSGAASNATAAIAAEDDFGAIGKMTLPAKSSVTTVMTFKLEPSEYHGAGVIGIDYLPAHSGS